MLNRFTVLLALSSAVLLRGQTVGGRPVTGPIEHLDRYLRVDAAIERPAGAGTAAITLQVLNQYNKEITAFEVSYVVQYADGSQREQTWGEDLVGSNAQLAALGATELGRSNLLPGQVLSQSLPLPAGQNGQRAVRVTSSAKALVFADRTAVGDSKFVKMFSASRARQASAIGDALTEAGRALAAPDPKAAFDARIAELWDGRWRPGLEKVNMLRSVAVAFEQGGRPLAEKAVRSLEARRAALAEHAALREGGLQ